MDGYRSNKWTDVAYISEYVCADWNDETECDYVGEDIEVYGGSDYLVGDNERYSEETFWVNDPFKCPKCGYEIKYLELKVG